MTEYGQKKQVKWSNIDRKKLSDQMCTNQKVYINLLSHYLLQKKYKNRNKFRKNGKIITL